MTLVSANLMETDIGLAEIIDAHMEKGSPESQKPGIQIIRTASYPGAYQVTGTWSVKGDRIEIDFILTFDGKPVSQPFREKGNTARLDELAAKIADIITGNLPVK